MKYRVKYFIKLSLSSGGDSGSVKNAGTGQGSETNNCMVVELITGFWNLAVYFKQSLRMPQLQVAAQISRLLYIINIEDGTK
jgi:hypothetical protein